MRAFSRSVLLRYVVALLFVALATVLTLLFRPFAAPGAFLLLFCSVVLSAWYGGLGPGLMATILGGLALVYCIAEPIHSWSLVDPNDLLRLSLFVFMAVLLSWLIETLHATQRTAEEQARRLEVEEARYRRFLDTAHEGIWMIDALGKTSYVNRRLTEMLGYSEAEMLGRPLWSFLAPSSRLDAEQSWQRHKLGRKDRQDMLFQTKSGAAIWGLVSTTPTSDEVGAFAGALIMILDITQRKRAEESLRFLVDASQVLGSTLDFESTLRSVARLAVPALADWCAVDVLEDGEALRRIAVVHSDPAKEALAWELWRRFPPQPGDNSGVMTVLRTGRPMLVAEVSDALLQTNVRNAEHFELLRRLNLCSVLIVPLRARGRTFGAIMLAMAESARRYDNSDVALVETLARRATLAMDNALLYRDSQREIAERRQAEAHLRDQQKWLEAIVDWMPTPTLFLEPGTARVLFANKAAQSFAGGAYPVDATDGPTVVSNYCTDREGRLIARDQMPGVRVARGERLEKFEMDWHLPSGVRSLLLYGTLAPAMYGHPATALLKFQDITHLKQVEAELRRANSAKDEFLAMLAHELRNPLAPLVNALHILRLSPPNAEVASGALDIAHRQTHHLSRLVDDLLDVSRITRGKIQLRKEKIDLAEIIRSALETSQPMIDSRHHSLKVRVPPEPLSVYADPTRLSQVLANLLNNAAKYTEEGGAIFLEVEREGDQAVIRVRDTGIGIPAALLPHVFDLFVQADRSLDRSQGGLGIGLTLVRRLVELHGGEVSASSPGPRQGSEFVVRLPLWTGAPAVDDAFPPASASGANGQTKKILVVDDNADAAHSLALILRSHGHEVAEAHDGPSALAEAQQFQPNVVVLDIGLPQMDGYEVARRLREQFFGRPLRLIAMTGYGQEEDRRRSVAAGFDCHLVKPVDPHELERLLTTEPTAA